MFMDCSWIGGSVAYKTLNSLIGHERDYDICPECGVLNDIERDSCNMCGVELVGETESTGSDEHVAAVNKHILSEMEFYSSEYGTPIDDAGNYSIEV